MLCSSRRELTKAIEKIIKQGGEGLILRGVKSPYDRGRSPFLLKLKVRENEKKKKTRGESKRRRAGIKTVVGIKGRQGGFGNEIHGLSLHSPVV